MRKSFKDILKTLQQHFKNASVITSRDKLSELTGYTKPTVSQALEEFYSLGLIKMSYTGNDNKKVNFLLELTEKARTDAPEVPKDSLATSPLKRTSTFSTMLEFVNKNYVVVFDGKSWFVPQKVISEMIRYLITDKDTRGIVFDFVLARRKVEEVGDTDIVYTASKLRSKGISVSPTGRLSGTTPANNSLFIQLDWVRNYIINLKDKELAEGFLNIFDSFIFPLSQTDSLVGFGVVPKALKSSPKQQVKETHETSCLVKRIMVLEEKLTNLQAENSKLKGERQEKLTGNFFDNEAFNQACEEIGLSSAATESIRSHCQASAKRRIMEQAKKEPEISGYREVGEVCKIKYAEEKSSKFNYKRMAFSAFSQETERKLRG